MDCNGNYLRLGPQKENLQINLNLMTHFIVTFWVTKYVNGYVFNYRLKFLHAMSLAIVTIYDICLEICDGYLNEEWSVPFPADVWTFRDLLSIKILEEILSRENILVIHK